MSKKVLLFDDIQNPKAPYNNVVCSNDLVFVATQPPFNWETWELVGNNITEQAKQALENVKMFLERADSNMDKVIKIGIFLADINDFDAVNNVYKEYFSQRETQPVRFVLQTPFPNKKIKVEFEVVASI